MIRLISFRRIRIKIEEEKKICILHKCFIKFCVHDVSKSLRKFLFIVSHKDCAIYVQQ